MSKHTLGPWKVAPSWDDWTVVGPNKEEIIFQDGPYQTPTIRQPDAQLIAAAPELLEALETIVLVVGLTAFKHESQRAVLQEAVDLSRAVITKATQGDAK